jgi:hypothetical protein
MSGACRGDGVPDSRVRTMTRCLLLALLIAGLGFGLRQAIPVTPVDAAFQSVLHAYATPGSSPGNDQQHD